MTRLVETDIQGINTTLADYDTRLQHQTGYTLRQIAAYAAKTQAEERHFGRDFEIPFETPSHHQSCKVAVIPFTCGQGIINGFSSTVSGIAQYLGFDSFVTALPDAGGVAEAIRRGAAILMMADDDHFVAVNLSNHIVSDNSAATGRGYAAALNLMSGGLGDSRVLLIGAGTVGTSAGLALACYGAQVGVYDTRPQASANLAAAVFAKTGCLVTVEQDLESALQTYRIVYDASPEDGFIGQQHIGTDMIIAAPGIPLGVKADCLQLMAGRLIHDSLQIGVATMLFDVL